jgi:hypothetical protein
MKFTIVGIMCLLSLPVLAAQQAVTDTGEVVILNDDGTWVYLDRTEDTGTKIPTNLGTFTLPKQSTFNLKSTKTNMMLPSTLLN